MTKTAKKTIKVEKAPPQEDVLQKQLERTIEVLHKENKGRFWIDTRGFGHIIGLIPLARQVHFVKNPEGFNPYKATIEQKFAQFCTIDLKDRSTVDDYHDYYARKDQLALFNIKYICYKDLNKILNEIDDFVAMRDI